MLRCLLESRYLYRSKSIEFSGALAERLSPVDSSLDDAALDLLFSLLLLSVVLSRLSNPIGSLNFNFIRPEELSSETSKVGGICAIALAKSLVCGVLSTRSTPQTI